MSRTKNMSPYTLLHLLLVLVVVYYVEGHARLLRPPSRASLWRFGYNVRNNNYNDNEGYCGGREALIHKYNGLCGVCGDPWDQNPRDHERGGKYYEGFITANYEEGSTITAAVQVTANHKGYFEFRICPYDNPKAGDIEYSNGSDFVEVSQSCLNKHLLTIGETNDTKYYIPHTSPVMLNNISLKLPSGVVCNKCLFQWTYITGNSWGRFPNGTACIGCGLQETFKACSDVIINPKSNGSTTSTPPASTQSTTKSPNTEQSTEQSTELLSNSPTTEGTKWRATDASLTTLGKWTRILTSSLGTTTSLEADEPTKAETDSWYSSKFSATAKTATTTTEAATTTPTQAPTRRTTIKTRKCQAVGVWRRVPGIPTWCINNCRMGYCPASHCSPGCKNI
ncbi:uncharacterized protein LOC115219724 [Octopus sinensis]|uniref:Uncharacterized protein LOC115219724 n=1 Tax=Octopus sinensis TaxID=2607531 RepID=A0A6P7T4M4_9MOLL|nr:uncharacterized protein LOC115219724 [Octopus sinensis]XP_029645798.1 uncharacterized protein LOC115219724 [Octopus sinensis]